MVKTSLRRLLLGLLLLFFTVEVANAQRASAADWRTERDRLKRLIETAQEVLAAYPNDQARQLLAKAEGLTKEIDQKIAAQNFVQALVLIREATTMVEKAIKLGLESPLLRLHNRLQELLQRAESEVLGSGNREAIRLVQEARKNKLQGEQISRTQPLQAAQYFQAAITLLERALKLVGGNPSGDGNPIDLVNRARDYYLDLVKQLEERLPQCDNRAARRLLDQIKKQMQLAEEALRKGDNALALRFFNNAIRLLLRALDLCPAPLQDSGQTAAEVTNVRDMLSAAEEQVTASSDPRDRALLDWARKMLLEAEANIAAQKPQQAYRRLERARHLVEKVLRNKSQTPVDYQEQCEAALQQLHADIADVQEELKASNNGEAQNFLELARKASAEAEKICARKPHTLQSLVTFRAMLRLGHQFLLQGETLLQETTPATPDQEALRQRLQQLEATLNEVRGNAGSDQKGFAKILFDQAVDLRDRAQAAYQRGQYYLSAELCNLAFEILRETLKVGNG